MSGPNPGTSGPAAGGPNPGAGGPAAGGPKPEASWLEWTHSGPENVVPGVHRVPLPLPSDGLRAVNVYVIEAPDGLVLVDGGWALDESRAELGRAVKAAGHDLSDVQAFLVTHVHRDHYTQAVALRREFGSRVYLGAGERASLRLAAEPEVPPLAPSSACCGGRARRRWAGRSPH